MSTQSTMGRLRAANPTRAERLGNDVLLSEILATPDDTRLAQPRRLLLWPPLRRPFPLIAPALVIAASLVVRRFSDPLLRRRAAGSTCGGSCWPSVKRVEVLIADAPAVSVRVQGATAGGWTRVPARCKLACHVGMARREFSRRPSSSPPGGAGVSPLKLARPSFAFNRPCHRRARKGSLATR